MPDASKKEEGDNHMRIQVTATNIEHVPLPSLLQRAKAIQKKKENVSQDELTELELIQKHIVTRDCGILAEQLELDLPRPKREQYVSIVVEKLQHLNYYKRQVREIDENLKRPRLNVRFPSSRVMEPIHHKTTPAGSSIEVAVVEAEKEVHRLKDLKQELEAIINPLERALQFLKPEERQLVEKRFLQQSGKTDIQVMMSMEIGRQKYYQLKSTALIKIAESLHII